MAVGLRVDTTSTGKVPREPVRAVESAAARRRASSTTGRPLPTWALLLGWCTITMLRLGLMRSLAAWVVARLFDQLAFTAWFVAPRERALRADFCRALLDNVRSRIRAGQLSPAFMARWVALLVCAALHERRVAGAYQRRRGHRPPAFLVLSPTGRCNLRCRHCYAAGGEQPTARLDRATVDRLIEEQHALWGSSLAIISGGEPFLYDGGNGAEEQEPSGLDQTRSGSASNDSRACRSGLLDLIAAHPRTFFIVYSNGTRITPESAAALGRCGNVALLLSVEGDAARTDAIRGAGTHAAVLEAMGHLRRAGVLFGVSITACRGNLEQLVGDELFRRYTEQHGATFCWLLEQAALGRSTGTVGEQSALTLQDKQRLERRLRRQISEHGRLVVSFLHTPSAFGGCLGAGRGAEFFHIDWQGAIRHCVYSPVTLDCVHSLYERGGDLDELTQIPVTQALRSAQQVLARRPPHDPALYRTCPLVRLLERHPNLAAPAVGRSQGSTVHPLPLRLRLAPGKRRGNTSGPGSRRRERQQVAAASVLVPSRCRPGAVPTMEPLATSASRN